MTHHRSLYTKEQIAAAAALWRDGCTLHEMAEKLGITCSAAKNMTTSLYMRGTVKKGFVSKWRKKMEARAE
jgi:DNA-binding MarR family transcriptional regulator